MDLTIHIFAWHKHYSRWNLDLMPQRAPLPYPSGEFTFHPVIISHKDKVLGDNKLGSHRRPRLPNHTPPTVSDSGLKPWNGFTSKKRTPHKSAASNWPDIYPASPNEQQWLPAPSTQRSFQHQH